MNPYGVSGDLFRSDANQSANSFRDPLNIAHLYPGWGMNPSYQTPASDAPYRPAYQGPNPYASYQKPGFFGAMSQMFMPGYKDPYWGNPVDNNQSAFNAVGTRGLDAAAHVGQNWIAPAIAFGMATKVFQGVGASAGGKLVSGAVQGMGLGGMDMFFGKALSMGGTGKIATTLATRGMIGAVGAAFGAVALPYMAGQAVMEVIESGVYQPYIRSRQMTQTLQDNFAGIAFGGGIGNSISGRGISGAAAAGISTQIDRNAMRDMTFSANQYHGIGAMGMRSGLFDDVGSSGITSRVSSIASQIKMIMAISKDPNIQSAIEELGKLRLGGASISGGIGSQAASAYSSIGMHASAAGASVQKVMSTVGAQGQYMYQMNGLTPYLGQISAASAFSGFASAQRAGLLSTAQFARMGGLEGATQSAVAAQLTGAMTPYNRISLANQFLGGKAGSSVVDNVSRFGNMAAADPMKVAGGMALYGNHMLSQGLKDGGSAHLENQAIAYLKNNGRQPDAGGKYSPEVIASVLQTVIGATPEQVQAYASMRASETDPASLGQRMAGYRAQGKEQVMQSIVQNGTANTFLNNYISRPMTKGWQRLTTDVADTFAHPVARLAGEISDGAGSLYDSIMFGNTVSDRSQDSLAMGLDMEAIGRARKESSLDKYGLGKRTPGSVDKTRVLTALDSAARSGGPGSAEARKLLSLGFAGPESKELFAKFLRTQPGGKFADLADNLENSPELFNEVARAASGNIVAYGGGKEDLSGLSKIPGMGGDSVTNLKVLGQAGEIYDSNAALGLNIDDILQDKKYSDLASTMKGMSAPEKAARLRSMVEQGDVGGYSRAASVAGKSDGTLEGIAKLSGGTIRGMALNLTSTATREDRKSSRSAMLSAGKAVSEAAGNSVSQVDWSSFAKSSDKIDRGASLFWNSALIMRQVAVISAGGEAKAQNLLGKN